MYQMEKHSDGLRPFLIGALLIGAMLLGCAQTPVIGAPVDHARLKDGTYEGSYRGGPNKASVQVIIKDNNIVNIEILQHQAWRGKKAETAIVERIIAHQSTKVDAVSGATNSSRVIMNAVQNAIEKAYPN
jgi:uncharacterized protein with FMN-binding domain